MKRGRWEAIYNTDIVAVIAAWSVTRLNKYMATDGGGQMREVNGPYLLVRVFVFCWRISYERRG